MDKAKLTKRILLALMLLILVGILFPEKLEADDGGTVYYDALAYDVVKYHGMRHPVTGYWEGTTVNVLGLEVYGDMAEKTSVYGDTDAIVSVSFTTETGRGPFTAANEDLDEIRQWLASFRWLMPVEDDEPLLPGLDFFEITVEYEGGGTYTAPLGIGTLLSARYYIWGGPVPDAFYRTLGITSEE